MDQLEAWILPLSDTVSVALGRGELKYLEHVEPISQAEPTDQVTHAVRLERFPAEELPSSCLSAFRWHERLVPLVSLSKLIHLPENLPEGSRSSEQLVAIVAYQTQADETLRLGALPLYGVPKLVQVDPAQAQPCSQLEEPWREFSHAAFEQGQSRYPVLDLQRVFL